MAKDKYDFIQELLENKKLQPTQKERVLLLAKEEIKKDGALGKELEERVKKLEEMINISSEKIPTITKTPLITSQSEKIPIINHDPITIYKLLSSFKTSIFSKFLFCQSFITCQNPIKSLSFSR